MVCKMLCGDIKLSRYRTHEDYYWCKMCSAGISKLMYEEGAKLFCFCCGYRLSDRPFHHKSKRRLEELEMKVYY